MRSTFVRVLCAAGVAGTLAIGAAAPLHQATAAAKPTVTFVTDVGGLNDQGFNHLGAVGTAQGAGKVGWNYHYISSTSPSDYVKNLTTAASSSQMVVAVGFSLGDAMKTVSAQFPKVKFTIVDYNYTPPLPNVLGNIFHPEESSYLAGVLAAGISKSGTIGFVGGLNVPVIQTFAAGYKAGALSYNPKVKVLISYTGSFTDQSKGKLSGLQEISRGADVVFAAAGASGNGALAAAAQRHVWAIGVDADQNALQPNTVITSAVKHVEVAVSNAIVSAAHGTFKAGTLYWDLKNNGVGLASYHGLASKVPAGVNAAVATARAGIISGKIMVPTTLK